MIPVPKAALPNTEVLRASAHHLGASDQQRQYLLRRALGKTPCPACGHTITFLAAANAFHGKSPTDINAYNAGSHATDRGYRCPECKVELHHHLGLFGGEQWFTIHRAD